MKPVRIAMDAVRSLRLEDYVLEKKYDGHRVLLVCSGGRKELFTRLKVPIRVPDELGEQVKSMDLEDGTVLDGELWNPEKRGGWGTGKEPSVISFWDCISAGRRNMSTAGLEERRAALEEALRDRPKLVRVVESEPATDARVREVFVESSTVRREAASRSGFVHGVVLKRRGSPRRDHPRSTKESSDWMKVVFDGMSGWGG